MYRASDKQLNEKFFNYLKDNVAPGSRDEANKSWNYFNKINYVLDLNNYARAVVKEEVEIGEGNVTSKVIIVLDSMKNKRIISFFEFLLDLLSLKKYDIYITSLNKTSNQEVNKTVLNKELKWLNPKYIISFNNVVGSIDSNDMKDCNINEIDINKFYTMLDLMDKKDLSEEESTKLNTIKEEVWSACRCIQAGYSKVYNN